MGFTLYLGILTVIEVILYTFHFSLLVLLIAKRNHGFSSPFFSIFRIVLVADLFAYAGLVVQNKITQIPEFQSFFKTADFIAYALFTDLSCSSAVQFFGHALMALNRFTLLWFPIIQKKFWKRSWYIWMLLTIPVGHWLWKVNQQIRFVFFADESVVTAMVNTYVAGIYYTVQTTIYISTTCAAAIFSGLAFIKFYFYKQSSNNIHGSEKALLFVSFIIFAAQFLRCFYIVIKLFTSDPVVVNILAIFLPLLYDILAWAGSLSLIILSATTRQKYSKFYFGKKLQNVVFVSSAARNQTTQ